MRRTEFFCDLCINEKLVLAYGQYFSEEAGKDFDACKRHWNEVSQFAKDKANGITMGKVFKRNLR